MPFDVTLPDGTILQGVPDGTTKAQIAAKLNGAYGTGTPQQPQDGGAPSNTELTLEQQKALALAHARIRMEQAASGVGRADGTIDQEPSVLANAATGLGRIPGAIIGAPRAAMDLVDLATGQAGRKPESFIGRAAESVGHVLAPRAEDVDRVVFGAVGAKPYEPTTPAGRIGQAALTGAGAALVSPGAWLNALRSGGLTTTLRRLFQVATARAPEAGKVALASGAAEGAHELDPGSTVLPFAAALATHSGASTAGAGARIAADVGREVFAPASAGRRTAARTLATVRHDSSAALAQPTDAALTAAQGAAARTANDIGPGVPAYQAGAELRDALAKRQAELEQAREDLTAPTRKARDASAKPVNMSPISRLIDSKLEYAAGAQAAAIRGARSDLQASNALGLPRGQLRLRADQLAASRQAINARIAKATNSGDKASAAHLMDIRNALDAQINAAVPEAGRYNELYSMASRPLDPFNTDKGVVRAVPDAVARDRFGAFNGTPPSEIPDAFLRGSATKEKLDSLVAAFGGDKEAALGALEQHLAGKVQGALNADDTLDPAAFEKAIAPYRKSLGGNVGVWFPALAQKFDSATKARAALDALRTQRGVADSVRGGALRDSEGAITGESFGKWFDANKDALTRTQSPAAVMRLQSIARALKGRQGELANALRTELIPAAAGYALGGTEWGLMGALLHRSAKSAFSGIDAKRVAAWNDAIERAVLDPKHAEALVRTMGSVSNRAFSPTRALVRAIYRAPLAVSAGIGPREE